jgi:uncharacterized membrane protein HdeD (DUF308 family)
MRSILRIHDQRVLSGSFPFPSDYSLKECVMSTEPQTASFGPFQLELQQLRDHWVLLLVLGIAMVIIGVACMACSFVATLATATFFGTVLFVGGVVHIVNAVTCRNWRGFFVHLVAGVLYGVVGLIMMNHPVATAAGITIMLAAAFMVVGIIRIIVAAVERFQGWFWVLLNGFIDLLLGLFIWRHFPEDAFWIIGLFVGIDLILAGWTWVILAISVRSALPSKTT